MSEWDLVHGDSLEWMRAAVAGSVDAIVTSPPYGDQRSYKALAGDVPATRNRSRQQRADALDTAADWLEPFLAEMLRVVSPTGSLMLNLGVIFRNGEEHPYADETLHRARGMGWKLLHRMVWHKPNAGVHSHAAYMHLRHEWVFWLAPAVDAYRGYDKDTRTPHSETSLRRIGDAYKTGKDERYRKRSGGSGYAGHALHPDGARPATVFTAAVGAEKGIKHTAPMPVKLARWLVSLSCPPGGLVLDPFAGAATTGVAALERGRRFVGVELEKHHLPEARSRLGGVTPPLFV